MNKELEIAVRIVNEHPSMKGKSVDEVLKKVKEVYSYLVGLQESTGIERQDAGSVASTMSSSLVEDEEVEEEVQANVGDDDGGGDDDENEEFNDDSLDVLKNLHVFSKRM